MRYFSILLAVAGLIAPPSQIVTPFTVTADEDTPLVVRRSAYTFTFCPDRLLILMDGQDRPTTVLLETVPGPKPTPVPPLPVPVPIPVPPPAPTPPPPPPPQPTKLAHLRVLLVWETSASNGVPQLSVLFSTSVANYLNTHCMSDGDWSGWRRWDQNVDASRETPGWRAAAAAMRADTKPLPKMMIFNDTVLVESLVLPATEQAALGILKEYGGE